MALNKIQRINEDIQRVLAGLLREVKDPRVQQGMLSVTAADTTRDLRYCTVYISAFGVRDERDFIKGLTSAAGYLRRELGNALKIRYTPELIFKLDKSIEYGANISKLLSQTDAFGEDGGERHDD